MKTLKNSLILFSCSLTIIFVFWKTDSDITAALETKVRDVEAAAKDILGDLRFISNLSLLHNSIEFSSYATIEQVLSDYVSSSNRLTAALIFNMKNKRVVNALSTIPSIPTLELLASKDLNDIHSIKSNQINLLVLQKRIKGFDDFLLITFSEMSDGIALTNKRLPSKKIEVGDINLDVSFSESSFKTILFNSFIESIVLVFLVGLAIFSVVKYLTTNILEAYQLLEFRLKQLAEGIFEEQSYTLKSPFKSISQKIDQLSKKMLSQQETEKMLLKKAAISDTVKIVAHDVRKPLSIAKGAMALLRSKVEKSDTEFELALTETESKIVSASKSVEAMLEDILGYNAEIRLIIKPASIISLFKAALIESANWYPKPLKIPISTSWNHTSEVYCDFERMLRVLTNILTNACQAMNKKKGSIWLSTTEHNGIVEITIGNSYSSIPAGIIENIFDANFTHGKKNGNGLGLAVVKKTVEAHGGKVVVTSDEEKQIVEFKITLTASKVKDDAQKDLDQSLGDFHFRSETNRENNEKRAIQIELIQSFVKQKGSKIFMGILDDEDIFRQTVKGIVENSEIKDIVHVEEFGEPESLLSFELNKLDFLISDIDLESNLNGYDIVKKIREGEGERRLPICISSNKALSSDLQQALDAGATTFLPKPMTLDHLLKFMCDSINFHRQNQQS